MRGDGDGMSNIKLKPCPFCGGEAEIMSFTDDNGEYFAVVCKNDNCRCGEDYLWTETVNRQTAIDAWNRRVIE